jgi:Na+-transporting methylmalonyl-CoA/oxaloacetate decarboxylase gamma subunit
VKILGVRITFKRIAAVVIVLFLLGVVVVAVGGGGSNSNSSSSATPTAAATAAPSATPSAAPTTTAAFDPLLAKVATALKSEGYTATEQHNNPSINADDVAVDFTDAHNNTCVYIIRDDGAKSAGEVSAMTPDTTDKLVPQNDTNFALQAATLAFGHTPTVTENYLAGTGNYVGIDMDYIAYTYGNQRLFVSGSITAPS